MEQKRVKRRDTWHRRRPEQEVRTAFGGYFDTWYCTRHRYSAARENEASCGGVLKAVEGNGAFTMTIAMINVAYIM